MIAIEVENVSKRFRMRTVEPYTTLKTAFVNLLSGRRRPRRELSFHALKGISLKLEEGQTLGIIGRNGSGKSTLLKLLTGILRPDSGRIQVNGKVSALLELGAGFHPEFSGRENIYINASILGLSRQEIRKRFDGIVRFAELEAFIDEPVRTYSSGMYTRLGFAVAVHAVPDILLIDEILAVGDEVFQKKCYDKIAEFQRQGKTTVLVSHDLAAVKRWCDEALWLDDGAVRHLGAPEEVIERYLEAIAERARLPVTGGQATEEQVEGAEVMAVSGVCPDQSFQTAVHTEGEGWPVAAVTERDGRRWGSRKIEITSVRLLDRNARERSRYQSGEQMTVEIRYRVHRAVEEPVFGIAVVREDGLWCYGTNTDIDKIILPSLGQEGALEVVLEELNLIEGSYYLDVAVHRRDGSPYDYHSRRYLLSVRSDVKDVGVFRIPHSWSVRPVDSS